MSPSLLSRRLPLAAPDVQHEVLGRLPLACDFDEAVERAGQWPLKSGEIEIFQINVGKLCNQTCRHCHVDAGPDRRETMTRETMELCLQALEKTRIPTVDITGGAPELNPDFRWLVSECRARGRHVIDRCNLTVLELASQRDLAAFLANHEVEVVCSLPHYRAPNTDRQRGEGVYEKSIAALKRLNALGYGQGSPSLRLVLVTNPVGAYLPGSQASLEAEWKRELWRIHQVRFDALYCITNMPISRYLEWLIESGNLEGYMERLVSAFNPGAVKRSHVPEYDLDRMGRAAVRLRLQSDARPDRLAGRAGPHPGLSARRASGPADHRRPSLLRVHGRRRVELRWCHQHRLKVNFETEEKLSLSDTAGSVNIRSARSIMSRSKDFNSPPPRWPLCTWYRRPRPTPRGGGRSIG